MKGQRGETVHNRFGEICKLSSEVHEDCWEIKLEMYVERN